LDDQMSRTTLSVELFDQIVKALRSDDRGDGDQRGAPRVGLRAQAEVLLKPGTAMPPVLMWCRNLSANGIGLLHTKEVTAGSEFILRLAGDPHLSPRHLSCVVVHCKKAGPDLFTIGARIIRVLSHDEAAALAGQAA
jgi:hypothetical protein